MTRSLTIEISGTSFDVALYDTPAAADLAAALPCTIAMSRWGDEYYGRLPVPIAASGPRRDRFAVGEVALWPQGNALCIFFGPTPASTDDEPRMASPGVALGRIVSDLAPLHSFGPSLAAVILAAR